MTHVPAKSFSKIRLAFGAALLGAGLLASGASSAATPSAASQARAVAPSGQVAKGNNYTVESNAVGTCKAGAECKIELKLTAGDGFHVNNEYPYKFKANDLAGVDFTGTDASGKNVFSKAAGDFRADASNVHLGYLTLHFKLAKAGKVNITGTFKMSVCSAANCQLETVELTIPAEAS
jgi:hypothetical protein